MSSAPTVVQAKSAGNPFGTNTARSVSFASLPSAGNAVVVAISDQAAAGGGALSSVTDNQGNTYVAIQNETGPSSCAAHLYWCQSIGTPSGTFTVTVTYASANYIDFGIMEVAPATGAPKVILDQTGVNSASSVTSFTVSASGQNANPSELVVAVSTYQNTFNNQAVSDPPASGYTSWWNLRAYSPSDAGYKTSSATETSSASWTVGAANAAGIIATFTGGAQFSSRGTAKSTGVAAASTGIALASAGAAVSTALGFPGTLIYSGGRSVNTGTASLSTQIPIPSSGHSKSTGLSTLTNWASVTLAAPLYIGNGSILAPGSPWSNGAPAAGNTVYYDPTNLTVYSNGEVTGASELFKAQVEWLPSPGVSSSMTVQFSPFASVGASVSRSSGNLTTSIPLVSKSLRVSSGVAGFSVAAAFHSQGHAKSSGLSGLTTAIALASVGSAKRTGRASMLTSIPLSSHARNRSAGIAAMTSSIALASKGASVVLTHAAPFTAIALRSVGQSVSRGTGDQRQLILFTSAGRSVSIGRASLLTSIPLASVGASKNTSLGAIAFGASFKSIGSSRSTGTATITVGIRLESASRRKSTGSLLQLAPSRFGWAELTALSQTGVQSVESAYIENSACYIEAAYFDQDSKPFVPTVVSYRVDDVVSGQNLVPWTSVEPAQANEIAITSSQNYMVSVSRNSEEHQVLFQITDGFGNVAYERVLYSLIRVPGIG